jgi:hypothetical protein
MAGHLTGPGLPYTHSGPSDRSGDPHSHRAVSVYFDNTLCGKRARSGFRVGIISQMGFNLTISLVKQRTSCRERSCEAVWNWKAVLIPPLIVAIFLVPNPTTTWGFVQYN